MAKNVSLTAAFVHGLFYLNAFLWYIRELPYNEYARQDKVSPYLTYSVCVFVSVCVCVCVKAKAQAPVRTSIVKEVECSVYTKQFSRESDMRDTSV